jgi:outer membrane lipoprotein
MRVIFPAIAVAAALAGCATVPSQIAGEGFAVVSPQQAASQNAHGVRVRWGGEIIKVEPQADVTCFQVLSRNLYSDARPDHHRDESNGRFIACGKGFYDPAVYTEGRDVTVTGSVNGTEQQKVGEYNYTFPRVDADQVYLWSERSYYNYAYDPYWWGPGWGPYWPYWGWGWGYGWYGPTVVVVHSGHGHH